MWYNYKCKIIHKNINKTNMSIRKYTGNYKLIFGEPTLAEALKISPEDVAAFKSVISGELITTKEQARQVHEASPEVTKAAQEALLEARKKYGLPGKIASREDIQRRDEIAEAAAKLKLSIKN
jgi:predicted HicB family RNase H-like nuclease